MIETRRIGFLTALLGLCLVINSGCSESERTSSSPLAVIDRSANSANPSPPLQADEAVRQVLDGLRQQHARAIWDFLPPSYRADIQQLVRDFAERLDEQSWSRFVRTLQKARRILPQKLHVWGPQKTEQSNAAADSALSFNPAILTQLLDAIGESEFTDLGRLRSIEVDQFLDRTGDKILTSLAQITTGNAVCSNGDPFGRFADVNVELVSSTDSAKLIKVRWPDQEPTTHPFVRVEGHWIPQALADAWRSQFAEVRQRLLAWADTTRKEPHAWDAQFVAINELLDELAETNSNEKARDVWQSGISRLIVSWFDSVPPETAAEQTHGKNQAISPNPAARVKRADTEVLLPDESEK